MNNDLISREALRKDIEHLHSVYAKNKEWFYTDVLDHIDNAPTNEFPFVHVIIKHPLFGECDGWLDKQRNLLFFDFITTEAASKWNWSWEEDEK